MPALDAYATFKVPGLIHVGALVPLDCNSELAVPTWVNEVWLFPDW